MPDQAGFKFKIRQLNAGWSWTVYAECDGARVGGGVVATRAQAAAFVIRFITRRLHPGAVLPGQGAPDAARRAA